MKQTNDDDVVAIEKVPRKILLNSLKTARSLKPGEAMMIGCVDGNPEAIAIRDAWRPNLPIRTVSTEEFERMVNRNQVVFDGR